MANHNIGLSHYRESKDPYISPKSQWEKTDIVQVGEVGYGCAVGCRYCNQTSYGYNENERMAPYLGAAVDGGAISLNSKLMINNKLDKIISIDKLIPAVKDYFTYRPDADILLENFNDPGLDWRRTIEIMQRLHSDLGHTGAQIFITKLGIPEWVVEELNDLQKSGAKPIGIVTNSGMPLQIEPNSPPRLRRTAMERLKNGGVPVVMSMRPLVRGVNAGEDHIRHTLNYIKGIPDVITIGGLTVFQPSTLQEFEQAGYPLGEEYQGPEYSIVKVLPKDIPASVRRIAQEEGITAPIYDHTSCAVARVKSEKYDTPSHDRNAHWAGQEIPLFDTYCSTMCPPDQIEKCKSTAEIPVDNVITTVKQKLSAMGYANLNVTPSLTQVGQVVVQGGSLVYEELRALKDVSGWDVINLPTYEGLIHRSKQALVDEMQLDFDSVFKGGLQVGQEWYVGLSGIAADQFDLAVRWLRNKNRTRLKGINLDAIHSSQDIDELAEHMINNSHGIQEPEIIKQNLYTLCGM